MTIPATLFLWCRASDSIHYQDKKPLSFHLHTVLDSKSTIRMPTKAILDLQSLDIFSKKIYIWKTLVNLESSEVPPASLLTPLKRARKFITKGYPSIECHQCGISAHTFVYINLQLFCDLRHRCITGWVNNGTAAFLNSLFIFSSFLSV